jgi:hypothetical protein
MPLWKELSKTRAMQGHAWLCLAWPRILVLPSPGVYKAQNDLSSFFHLLSDVNCQVVEDTTEFFTLISKSLSLSLLHSHLREGEKYNNVGWLFDLFIASSCVGFPNFPKSKNPWFLEFTWQRD